MNSLDFHRQSEFIEAGECFLRKLKGWPSLAKFCTNGQFGTALPPGNMGMVLCAITVCPGRVLGGGRNSLKQLRTLKH